MKDFFDTWKFKILVAVAVFLVGIMAYAGANGRLTAAPQELLGAVLMPLQKVTSALSGGIGSVWEKYTSIDEVMEQNEQLEAENAFLLPFSDGTVVVAPDGILPVVAGFRHFANLYFVYPYAESRAGGRIDEAVFITEG